MTDGAVNISLLEGETIDNANNKWSAAAKNGYVIDDAEGKKPSYAGGKLTVHVKDSALTADVGVTPVTPTVTAAASLTEVISGGKTTLTATSTGLSNAATYAWFYKIGDSKEFSIGTGKSLVWTVPAANDYSVYCKASEGDKLAKKSEPITVKGLPGMPRKRYADADRSDRDFGGELCEYLRFSRCPGHSDLLLCFRQPQHRNCDEPDDRRADRNAQSKRLYHCHRKGDL